MSWIGRHLVYGELPSDTRAFALEALEVARATGARDEEGIVNGTLGVAFAYGGDAETGLAHYREAIRIARELGRGERLASAVNNLGDALPMLGRADEALATLEAGYEEVRAARAGPLGGGAAAGDGGGVRAAPGPLGRGRGAAGAAARAHPRRRAAARGDRVPRRAARAAGRLRGRGGARPRGDGAADRERRRRGSIVATNAARAELALLRGDPEAARAIVRDTHDSIRWGGIVCYPSMLLVGVQAEADLAERARAAGHADEVERARGSAEELVGSPECAGSLLDYRFEHPVGDPAPPETRAVHAQAEAELARLDGAPRPEPWAQAAERWERLGFPYPAAAARLREAEARLAAGGERAAAATSLRAAHATLVRLGAAPLRERRGDARAARADRRWRSPASRPSGRSISPSAS